jgi:hypothetical protein
MYDIGSKKMENLGQIRGTTRGDSGCTHEIICDLNKNVYGSCSAGFLFKYDWDEHELLETPIALPGGDCRIDCLVRTPDGIIYGGTWENGHLFSFDPDTEKLEEVAWPNQGPRLSGLVYFQGRLIGAAGGGDQYDTRTAFLFEYDPKRKEMTEIGSIFDEKGKVRAQRIHAMVIDGNGRIYAGETGASKKRVGEEIEVGGNAFMYVCDIKG